jgi:CheY-like chemotaxis protein
MKSGHDAMSNAEAKPKRVLVVDDNEDAAEMLAEMVGLLGHDVKISHDGRGALERAKGFEPDVVFLDIGLPEMDGYAVARALREMEVDGRHAYLVALTGYGRPQDVDEAKQAGFDRHLLKPVKLEDIMGVLTA